MKLEALKKMFEGIFPLEQRPQLFFSPGRVNLIGEHIDYNGGAVFPAAITFGTYGAITPREDRKVCLYSGNFKECGVIEFDLDDLSRSQDEHWTIYVKAVISQFIKAGYEIKKGFNGYIEGNIPNGAGLSSSASLELLIAQILQELNDLELNMIEKVKLSQKAENEYVGVQCGIMDQFAIGMGKKDYAIKLNTNDLSYEYALANLQDCSILIMNTNKKRQLADSKYNERRAECEQALTLLQTQKEIEYLCDLTPTEFEIVGAAILKDNTLYRRARHAITENNRVQLAVKALANEDLAQFGNLLNESHRSLRDDYEVTGRELDTIVELAWQQPGVIGARMTGAGFGGCALAIVKNHELVNVQEQIAQNYKAQIGYDAHFYVASIGDGTKTLTNC